MHLWHPNCTFCNLVTCYTGAALVYGVGLGTIHHHTLWVSVLRRGYTGDVSAAFFSHCLMCVWHNSYAPIWINPVVYTERIMANIFTRSIELSSSHSHSLRILWRDFLRVHLLLSGMWFHIWIHQLKYTAMSRFVFLSWIHFSGNAEDLIVIMFSMCKNVWFNVIIMTSHMGYHSHMSTCIAI